MLLQSVVICVPVRDEAAQLPALLRALAGLSGAADRTTVCLYLDGCEDDGAVVAAGIAPCLPFPIAIDSGARSGPPNAGRARAAAMAMGLRVLAGREGLMFSTDADSRPRRDWIVAGDAALAVAEVAAGRVVRIDAAVDPVQSRIELYYDRLHRLRRTIDPVAWEARDTHHYAAGANIAIRASAYRALGGFRPLPWSEDATLLDDAARAGMRVRRDGAMIVDTSSRRIGRAEQGLASSLRLLAEGQAPLVGHPAGAAWQWHAQAVARHAFAAIDSVDVRRRIGDRLGLTADHVLGVARDCPNGEAFAMRIVPPPPADAGPVSLDVGEAALAALEADLAEVAA